MKLIELIPIGKKYKISRQTLMYKTKLKDKELNKEIAKLRKDYIVLYDDGYYLPASEIEYLEFIYKLQKQKADIDKTIMLARKEMEEAKNV